MNFSDFEICRFSPHGCIIPTPLFTLPYEPNDCIDMMHQKLAEYLGVTPSRHAVFRIEDKESQNVVYIQFEIGELIFGLSCETASPTY